MVAGGSTPRARASGRRTPRLGSWAATCRSDLPPRGQVTWNKDRGGLRAAKVPDAWMRARTARAVGLAARLSGWTSTTARSAAGAARPGARGQLVPAAGDALHAALGRRADRRMGGTRSTARRSSAARSSCEARRRALGDPSRTRRASTPLSPATAPAGSCAGAAQRGVEGVAHLLQPLLVLVRAVLRLARVGVEVVELGTRAVFGP